MQKRNTLEVLTVAAGIAVSAPAFAQQVAIAWDMDRVQRTGYADLLWPVVSSGSGVTHALVIDAGLSHVAYRFPDTGGTSRWTSSGGGASVGYQRDAEGSRLVVLVGVERRTSSLNIPFTPTLSSAETGVTADAELEADVTSRWLVTASADVAHVDRVMLLRSGLLRRLGETFSVGGEAGVQRNTDERAFEFGPAASLDVRRLSLTVDVRAGVARWRYDDATTEWRPYTGIAVTWER